MVNGHPQDLLDLNRIKEGIELVIPVIPGTPGTYPSDDFLEGLDEDGDGTMNQYQLTLKFNRDLLIAGFTDENGVGLSLPQTSSRPS